MIHAKADKKSDQDLVREGNNRWDGDSGLLSERDRRRGMQRGYLKEQSQVLRMISQSSHEPIISSAEMTENLERAGHTHNANQKKGG